MPAGISANLDPELGLAQSVEVSAYWQVNEELALLGTFNWEDWSGADDLTITVAGRTINAQLGFEDTYKIGIGANYQIAEAWLLQTGIMVDTSAFKNKNRTTALPVDEQVRFSVGALYDLTDIDDAGLLVHLRQPWAGRGPSADRSRRLQEQRPVRAGLQRCLRQASLERQADDVRFDALGEGARSG